jgi:hypothetical protein
VYDIFYDVNDVAEHSLQQLCNSLWFDDWVDTEWLFNKLRKNRSILDLIGNKGMCAAKTVRNKLQKLHQDGDEGFVQNFMLEYLSKDQRKKLAGGVRWKCRNAGLVLSFVWPKSFNSEKYC